MGKTTLFVALSFASLADAQVDRVLHFTTAESAQDFQEIGTVVGRIADIQATVDVTEKALRLRGTATQISLAEWLFTKLDKPVVEGDHQYTISDNGDDVVRVFYLDNTETVQRLQEVATVVRSISDVRRLFTYNALRAVALRGTTQQLSLAEFLFHELDKPTAADSPFRASAEHTYSPGGQESAVRVFYLPQTKTVLDFQELATTVRTISSVRRMFTYNAPRAVAIRATAGQMALADWLFNQLATPTPETGLYQYRPPSTSDEVVRVFYLTHAQTVQRLKEIAMQAQRVTEHRTALPYHPANAIVLLGTDHEVATAARLIEAEDR